MLDLDEVQLKCIMKKVDNYMHNESNEQLLNAEVGERTLCGCMKEVLDSLFRPYGYFVDLEYNRDNHLEKSISIPLNPKNDMSEELERIVKDMNIYVPLEKIDYLFTKQYINEYLLKHYKLIGNDLYKKNKLDLIKLALIKKYTNLNYKYYVYYEIGESKEKSKCYYLDNSEDNYEFKEI